MLLLRGLLSRGIEYIYRAWWDIEQFVLSVYVWIGGDEIGAERLDTLPREITNTFVVENVDRFVSILVHIIGCAV